jgi:hypothetical protein
VLETELLSASSWFDDLPVLGNLPPTEAVAKLREAGEAEAAAALETASQEAGGRVFSLPRLRWPFQDKPWQHTAHTFGFLAPVASTRTIPIAAIGDVPADVSLRGSRIKITLDRLRVAAYPGGGTHRVLLDFYAQNQVPGTVEHLHFTASLRAREGEHVAVVGYPIFVGLNVGDEGVQFKCFTVNVKNDEDEKFLGFLESDTFKEGLKLATSVQPALAPLSAMAVGLTRSIATRNRNVPVQDFYLGLDFSSIPMRARLAEGSYLAVQVPETFLKVWDWQEWVYEPSSGHVVSREEPAKLIPYNYLVFSVSRYGAG